MGSLVPGWYKKKIRPPKGMEDFEEPSKISPRASLVRTSLEPKGPPSLARTSCPPSFHASVLPPNRSSSGSGVAPMKVVISRRSVGPGSPRASSPRSPQLGSSAPHSPTFERILESSEDPDEKLRWCDRFDSAQLNAHPDEAVDEGEWRHGSFRLEDPTHSHHLH